MGIIPRTRGTATRTVAARTTGSGFAREAGREELRVLGVAGNAMFPLPIALVVQMRDCADGQQGEPREGSPPEHPAPVRPHGTHSWPSGRKRQMPPVSDVARCSELCGVVEHDGYAEPDVSISNRPCEGENRMASVSKARPTAPLR